MVSPYNSGQSYIFNLPLPLVLGLQECAIIPNLCQIYIDFQHLHVRALPLVLTVFSWFIFERNSYAPACKFRLRCLASRENKLSGRTVHATESRRLEAQTPESSHSVCHRGSSLFPSNFNDNTGEVMPTGGLLTKHPGMFYWRMSQWQVSAWHHQRIPDGWKENCCEHQTYCFPKRFGLGELFVAQKGRNVRQCQDPRCLLGARFVNSSFKV